MISGNNLIFFSFVVVIFLIFFFRGVVIGISYGWLKNCYFSINLLINLSSIMGILYIEFLNF